MNNVYRNEKNKELHISIWRTSIKILSYHHLCKNHYNSPTALVKQIIHLTKTEIIKNIHFSWKQIIGKNYHRVLSMIEPH